MSKALVLPSPAAGALATPLEELVERANVYAADARASSTRRAYLTDFRAFEVWCARQVLVPLPATPATVSVYLSTLADAGKRASTIERALTGIAHAQRAAGHDWPRAHPSIASVMGGIRRRLGTAAAQKDPVCDDELVALVATLADDLVGRRDRILLTLGWFGAFRRSELVALDVGDIKRTREGLVVTVKRSKTDPEGRGASKGIAYASRTDCCVVRALDAWLEASGIVSGPLLRAIDQHGHLRATRLYNGSVARIVQRVAKRAGFDPAKIGGHSLRAGFATTAAKRGKSLDAIMRQTLHKSESVARGYIRHAGMFEDNATVGLL